ncbi:MAG: DUF1311 domain-containing protein [Proteobacteria bacterium]|jgi:uncharacterized protein YecT (DUF1311 family)|nr:DUF1311 domain-containing protein [Pseudomonadota bacterium]
MSFVLVLWSVSFTWAASFDCAKAATPVEKLVCDSPELSQLDDDLGANYRGLLDATEKDERHPIRSQQKEWLRFRDARCLVPPNPQGEAREMSVECLAEQYRRGHWQLDSIHPCIDSGLTDVDPKEKWACPEGEVPLTKKVCEEAYTTLAMAFCTDLDAARAHRKFVSAYIKVLDSAEKRVGENREVFEHYALALKEEQDAWERLSKPTCEIEGLQFEGGTLQGLTIAGCSLDRIKKRTAQLTPFAETDF